MLPTTETRKRFTVAEFDRMGEAGVLGADDRLELIDGEIVEMNPIGSRHTISVDFLTELLIAPAKTAGAHVSTGGALVLGDASEVYPDVTIRRGQRRRYSDAHPRAADVLLVAEVADSSLSYDKDVKVPRYARAGVREVWLVDLTHSVVVVHTDPSVDGYRVVRPYRPGDALRSESLPGCELDVTEILGL